MAGEKRFGTSLFGFKKSDVNVYIEKILKEFADKLKEKDDEISSLKNQNKDIKTRYEEVTKDIDQINEDRAKIAEVLIKAQDKAELIMEEARLQAAEEKKRLEHLVEAEREKLVDIKEELKKLKSEAVSSLRKFEFQLDDLIEEEAAETFEDSILEAAAMKIDELDD